MTKPVTVKAELYSKPFHDMVLSFADLSLGDHDAITIDQQESTITLSGGKEVVVGSCETDVVSGIVGMYTLPMFIRTALPTASFELVETLATKLGMAFGCGELELVSEITPEMYETEMEHGPFKGFRTDYLQRWRQAGVVCLTDVLMEDSVWVGDHPVRIFPTVYPALIVGKYLAFNQPVTVPYSVTRQNLDSLDNGPTVCGAVIFQSLGTATVNQKGQHAEVTHNDEKWVADIMGCRKVD